MDATIDRLMLSPLYRNLIEQPHNDATPPLDEVRALELDRVAIHFQAIGPERIRQDIPEYAGDGCVACVGAHLAELYGVAFGDTTDYQRGKIALASALGMRLDELDELLELHGANFDYWQAQQDDPRAHKDGVFGALEWETPPAVVFRRASGYFGRGRRELPS